MNQHNKTDAIHILALQSLFVLNKILINAYQKWCAPSNQCYSNYPSALVNSVKYMGFIRYSPVSNHIQVEQESISQA